MRKELTDAMEKVENNLALIRMKLGSGAKLTQGDYLNFYLVSSKLQNQVLAEFYEARTGKYPE